MPNLFQNNWQPQIMPQTNMALQNNFNNFNLASLGQSQQYPPQNTYPSQQNPMMQQQPTNINNNLGQNPMMEQQYNNSAMGMNQGGMGMNQGY